MAIVSLSDVAIRFGGVPLLEGINLTVQPGERWGIIGRNGSGKTTLMHIVIGSRVADQGSVSRAGRTRIAVLDQDRDLGDAKTVWSAAARGFGSLFDREADLMVQSEAMGVAGDDVSQAMLDRYATDQERFEHDGGYQAHARVDAVLSGLGFDPELAHNQDVDTLSGGERGRLALACQLATPADLLILDEPTNHLDLATTKWLEGYLKDLPEAVLLISHDRAFLTAVIDHVLHLEGGTTQSYTGGWDAFVVQRTERRLSLNRAVQKQATMIASEEEYIRRHIAGQNTAQAKGRRRRLRRVSRLSAPPGAEGAMMLKFELGLRGGDQILVTEQLKVGIGNRTLVEPWSGMLRRGERVGLIGPNGAGKSTFLRTILGERPCQGGKLRLMPSVEVAYYRQDLSDVDPDSSIYSLIENRRPLWTRGKVQDHLGRFGFSGDEVLRLAGTLSGGERARVALAILILEPANLLVFDEPTNHLDIESIEALEDALGDYPGTVLLVSHDRALLETLTTRIWAITNCQLDDYPGSFGEWQAAESRRRESENAQANREVTSAVDPRTDTKAKAAGRRRQERTLLAAEKRVAQLEGELSRCESVLSNPALYSEVGGPQRAADHVTKRDQLRNDLEVAMAEWESAAISD
jgi:ATP-binding cassette subfamily F protein 3